MREYRVTAQNTSAHGAAQWTSPFQLHITSRRMFCQLVGPFLSAIAVIGRCHCWLRATNYRSRAKQKGVIAYPSSLPTGRSCLLAPVGQITGCEFSDCGRRRWCRRWKMRHLFGINPCCPRVFSKGRGVLKYLLCSRPQTLPFTQMFPGPVSTSR